MKKPGISILLIIEMMCIGLLIGFFLGRNLGKSPVYVSQLPEATTAATQQPVTKININTADTDELQTLPGIGAVLAGRIIDYRQTNGPFETTSELTNVEGIGLDRLTQMMDYITVN